LGSAEVIKTKSELLLEQFCRDVGLLLVPIPTEARAARRTPDYELALGELRVVVEVKQIDPNKEEVKAERAHTASGEPFAFQSTPGSRLRGKISQAARQLRTRREHEQPGLVVVYNNVCFRPVLTSEHNVLAAMYGRLAIRLSISRTGPIISEPRLAGDRSFDPKTNTVVSALGILSQQQPTKLAIYHNNFARAPIDPDLFRIARVRQYRHYCAEPGARPGWAEI
jgi:hypothetical protein